MIFFWERWGGGVIIRNNLTGIHLKYLKYGMVFDDF